MSVPRRELLLGCGSNRVKKMADPAFPAWSGLTTLDHVATHKPDVVADLDSPLPFPADTFAEAHAYEVLEHLGRLGDERAFFFHFSELWRVLEMGGLLFATVPPWNSIWAFGDPSHRRIINSGSLVFLNQDEYRRQVGHTPMTDYRGIWKGSFATVHSEESPEAYRFILQKREGIA